MAQEVIAEATSYASSGTAEADGSRGSGTIYVGVSVGGLIALDIARCDPSVRGIVLIDTVDRYPDTWRQTWATRALTARTEGMSALVEPTIAMWFSNEFADSSPASVSYVSEVLESTDPEGYARTCEALADATDDVDLGTITCPTQVLCGTNDLAIFTDAATRLAAQIPGATLEWLPGRHAAAYESAEQTCSFITDFVRRVSTQEV
jgi:3-oxoadipate enol-lactonase